MKAESTRGFRGVVPVWAAAGAAAFALALSVAGPVSAAGADDASHASGAAAAHARAGCVDVEVNGQRSPSYDCLTNQLQPASSPLAGGRAPGLESEDIANKPGNQIGGQFNWSATSQRMGNAFGNSATPQRPATPPPTPIIPGR
ncbi:hypothetical protein [Pandoraea apista]|uniref:Uncharacterized protein n=1 Tax=Pandoraea apista TaxID=93218 RepID=A0A5E5PBE3_9BURK|nr:hypothetical protein [Pandoraea apista]OXS96861.1 hypothetical protein B7H01_04260 [Pandoraea apista]PTD98507.1 hypothetical protein C7830_23945 [Pandoraea apista]RRJ25766.1 hypothetical protein EIB05_23780 [Pandoraea apista]RRJ73192.1 hypothetical protein EIL82_21850 [Pandoraea apista]RSC97744.1 hypothetical protein EJB12_24495 [Pandoraea apista]